MGARVIATSFRSGCWSGAGGRPACDAGGARSDIAVASLMLDAIEMISRSSSWRWDWHPACFGAAAASGGVGCAAVARGSAAAAIALQRWRHEAD
jgi:hypothetical protein